MRTGPLLVGFVMLIMAVIVYNRIQLSFTDCQSFLEQLGSFFSSDFSPHCLLSQEIRLGSLGVGIIGVIVLIYGFVAHFRRSVK